MSWRKLGGSMQESEKEVRGLAARGIFSLCARNGGADWGSERGNEKTVCGSMDRFVWLELLMVGCGSCLKSCCPSW